jgi:hypothetical protein
LEFAQPLHDVGGFGGVGIRFGQIKSVILDGIVGLMIARGDFSLAVGVLIGIRKHF